MAPKIVFIIPYRDREFDKIHYQLYMTYIMEDYDPMDYQIYFSHQKDSRPFNRGATKNIGFLAVKNKYPEYKDITFVFNDIDILPCKKNFINYETQQGIVKHFYGFKHCLGGIFSIKGADFERCDGFINNWGWGWEDNQMCKTVKLNNIAIDHSEFYHYDDKNIMQMSKESIKLIVPREQATYKSGLNSDTMSKIKNLTYTIDKTEQLSNRIIIPDNRFIINIDNFETELKHDNLQKLDYGEIYNKTIKNQKSILSKPRRRGGIMKMAFSKN